MQISTALRDKGQRLVDQDKVTHIKGLVYQVEGDTATYSVYLSYPEQVSGRCACPRSQNGFMCSHLFAASIYALAFPPDPPAPRTDDPFAGLN